MTESNVVASPVLRASGFAKNYGSVAALTSGDLTLDAGEIVALLGDNGAGKSTFVKLLAGAEAPTSGTLEVNGEEVQFSSPADARRVGIETIYQDLALADNLSVASNLFLGREVMRRAPLGTLGLVNHAEMRARATRLLKELGVQGVPAAEKVDQLSGGQRQIVAICRAATFGSRIVILDEPTAALGVRESRRVLDFMVGLRERNLSVLWICHNMHQVQAVADRAVVMRLGQTVADICGPDLTATALTNLLDRGE